jgi:DNA repair exonuclease SbcCD nuclease subunit
VNNFKELVTTSEQVCCIADLHIGVHQNSIFWHETALKWAAWLKSELQKKKIKDIFILGDVYHYRDEIAVNTIHVVNQIFNMWSEFNITIVVGNHDAFYKDRADINSLSILNGWDNIIVISTPTTYTLYGKKALFLPWGSNVSELQKVDMIFGHLEIESFKMNSFKLCDKGIKTKDLLNVSPFIMSGHFHLRDERKYDKGTIIYVGNPFEMDFGDAGSTKGYYILNLNTLNYTFHENIDSPKHLKITLSDVLSKKSLKDCDTANNIIKLIIDKKVDADNIDNLIEKFSKTKPFSLSVDYSLINLNPTASEDNNYDLSGVDVQKAIEEFINLLDINTKKETIEYCLDIYKRAIR